MADFFRRDLAAEGRVVAVASDGHEGHRYSSSEEFDIILLDIILPGMSGLEVS